MKKLTTLLLVAVLAIGLTGCGLFSTGDDAGSKASGSDTIAITDTLNHEDPAGLEYAERYALTTGKDVAELVEAFKAEYGVDFVEQVAVIYADKDNKVAGEHDYYVFATPEDAEKFGEVFDTASRGGSVIGNVVSEFSPAETINAMIAINIQYNSMSEDTATAYVEFMKDANLMMNVQ